jgi:hypothetical protein
MKFNLVNEVNLPKLTGMLGIAENTLAAMQVQINSIIDKGDSETTKISMSLQANI